MAIIIKNYIKNLKNEKAHYIFIGFPLIISICIGFTLKGKMFEEYADTKQRLFAIVCVAIWIGLFNSVLEICKERPTIKADLRSGFNAIELFLARFLVQGVICLFQAIIIYGICSLFVDFPEEGALTTSCALELIISIFLITFSADIMGLLISSLCPTNDVANRSLPFILMVQFIFSGQLFELGESLEKISKLTVSKWGMDLLGSICDISQLSGTELLEKSDLDVYKFTGQNIIDIWSIFVIFLLVFSVLSIIFIQKIKYNKK